MGRKWAGNGARNGLEMGPEMGWEWGQKWDGNGLRMDYEWIG